MISDQHTFSRAKKQCAACADSSIINTSDINRIPIRVGTAVKYINSDTVGCKVCIILYDTVLPDFFSMKNVAEETKVEAGTAVVEAESTESENKQ